MKRRHLVAGTIVVAVAAGCIHSTELAERRDSSDAAPNVILITLDTTRRDRLGCYGYSRDTIPSLDLLAQDSVLFTRATATSSWTLPTHASLFTGKFPSAHGAHHDPHGDRALSDALDDDGKHEYLRANSLSVEEQTMAELLKENGYSTGAVVAGPWLKRIFGIAQGFDFYDDSSFDSSDGARADEITRRAIRFIGQHTHEKFFLFLNYFDPHGPLSDPWDLARTWNPDRKHPLPSDRYDGEVLYMDYHIGLLLDHLKEVELYERTWIIVTADHGELLNEHGTSGHGSSLYQQEIAIPLLIKYPSGVIAPHRSDRAIQQTDILPMLLDRLGIPRPEGVTGGIPRRIDHPTFAEVYPLDEMSSDGAWLAIFEGRYKLLWNSLGRHQLFDLRTDPDELHNLARAEPERVRDMALAITEFLDLQPRPAAPGDRELVDEETRRALQSLGYLE